MSPTVVVVDSGGANTASLEYAFERIGARTRISAEMQELQSADRVVLPGVGHAASIMERLHDRGLAEALVSLQCPVLGICLGMQVMLDYSEEGDTTCLGVVQGEVVKMRSSTKMPVPHMGWNVVNSLNDDPLLRGCNKEWFYFVHSYCVPASNPASVAEVSYAMPISAVIRKENFVGVQFHPERSGVAGSTLLRNFVEGNR